MFSQRLPVSLIEALNEVSRCEQLPVSEILVAILGAEFDWTPKRPRS